MRKLNNKGMSIIEIVLTFAIIMVIVVGMLSIIMNYRNKVSISMERLKLSTFKNTITKDIQDDILRLGISSIDKEGYCRSVSGLRQCINIVFKDGTEKALGISQINVNDKNSIENIR